MDLWLSLFWNFRMKSRQHEYLPQGRNFSNTWHSVDQTEVSLSEGKPVAEGILTWWSESLAFMEDTDACNCGSFRTLESRASGGDPCWLLLRGTRQNNRLRNAVHHMSMERP